MEGKEENDETMKEEEKKNCWSNRGGNEGSGMGKRIGGSDERMESEEGKPDEVT